MTPPSERATVTITLIVQGALCGLWFILGRKSMCKYRDAVRRCHELLVNAPVDPDADAAWQSDCDAELSVCNASDRDCPVVK